MQAASQNEDDCMSEIIKYMLNDGNEARGTLEDIATDSTFTLIFSSDYGRLITINPALTELPVQPGTIASRSAPLSDTARASLYAFYNANGPRVHYALERNHAPNTRVLHDNAQFYNYALLDGRRITPTSRSRRELVGSSIIKYIWNGEPYGGEVINIFHHAQPNTDSSTLFAEIRWMKRSNHSPLCSHENPYPWHEL